MFRRAVMPGPLAAFFSAMMFATAADYAVAGNPTVVDATITCHLTFEQPLSLEPCFSKDGFVEAAGESHHVLVQACSDSEEAKANSFLIATAIRIKVIDQTGKPVTIGGWDGKSVHFDCTSHPNWFIVTTTRQTSSP